MKKLYMVGIAGIAFILVGFILGPSLILIAINRTDSTDISSQNSDTSFEHRNPAAPLRNAREQEIFSKLPRDSAYTQALPVFEEKNVPWNFYTTEKWPIPSTFSDFGTRLILLPFDKHGKLGEDISYIGVQGPQSNIYPVFNTLSGSVITLSDNETIVYYAAAGAYPNKLTDTCDEPSPEETPWGPLGSITKRSDTGNPYGSYISERNSRWICVNYSDVFKRGGRYYSDKMKPAPTWKNWGCSVAPSGNSCIDSPSGNPCGECVFHPEETEWKCHGNPKVCDWETTPAYCTEKALCEPVPAQSECIMGHGEFRDPLNELAGHAMMKVPDYETLTSHFSGGNRATDAAMDGSLGKMTVVAKAGKPSIKSLLYYIIAPDNDIFFTDPLANLGTDGSSEWPSDTLSPMVHYETFRNLNVCEPMTTLDIPVTLTSIDPYGVTSQYVDVDPLDYSPCQLPPNPPDACDLVLLYDGLPENNTNGRGGYHGDQYDNAYDVGVRPHDGPDEPSIAEVSSIIADTIIWPYPQLVEHDGYIKSEITQ